MNIAKKKKNLRHADVVFFSIRLDASANKISAPARTFSRRLSETLV